MYKRIQTAWAILLTTATLFISSLALGQTTGHLSNSERSPSIAALVEDRYGKADELRKAGKNQEALIVINEAVRFDSDCGKCWALRSGIQGNLGHYVEGIGDGAVGEQRSKTPRHKAMAAYNRGYNLGSLNRYSEAYDSYLHSVEYDPTFAMAHFGVGKVLYQNGDFAKSKTALEKALELNPKHGAAWAYLSEDQIFLDDVKAGLESANKAVEFAPSDARSFRARALAHLGGKDYQAMLADATRALEIDPTRPQLHLMRGHALTFLGRYSEAAAELALEPDRKAVDALVTPKEPVDLRIYNCGDDSTELQSPTNFNIDGFTACVERATRSLEQSTVQPDVLPKPNRTVPGFPTKRPAQH